MRNESRNSKPNALVRVKDFAVIRVKASFKLFGSILSVGIKNLLALTIVGAVATGVVLGDVYDPLERTQLVDAQQPAAANILIEIRDIVQEIEQGGFPPGPPGGLPAEFLAQIDGIEAKVDCLADVLNGVETSC